MPKKTLPDMTTPSSDGRSVKGGGVTPAPLSPHPASQIFPPMSEEEFAGLRKDIAERGLLDDIMLFEGQILDGNNRYRACNETGVEPRTKNWRGDDPIAFAISKNLHRRHLSRTQLAAAAAETEHLYEAEAKARRTANLPNTKTANLQFREEEKGTAMSKAVKAMGGAVSERSAYDAKKVKARSSETFEGMKNGTVKSVRAGLKAVGLDKGPGGGKAKPKTKPKATPKVVPEHVAQAARIRQSEAETKYQSMLNAPTGKLNLPLLDRASKVQELLSELTGLTPEQAVSGIPALRCREYSVEMAEWWLDFVKRCDARRLKETPELPTLYRRSRLAVANPVAQGRATLSKEERHLHPGEQAALDWLRNPEVTKPVTVAMMANGLRLTKPAASSIIHTLCASGLAEEVGKVDRFLVYQATQVA